MTKHVIWILAAALTWLPTAASAGQADISAVPRISVSDLKKALAENAVAVVDVRSATAFEAGHIPGALSIPLAEVPAKTAVLKALKKPIVFYCA